MCACVSLRLSLCEKVSILTLKVAENVALDTSFLVSHSMGERKTLKFNSFSHRFFLSTATNGHFLQNKRAGEVAT